MRVVVETMLSVRLVAIVAATLCVAGTASADPPGQVGRVSFVEGEVGLLNLDTGQSTDVMPNWPVTRHVEVATASDARGEIQVGSSTVRLDSDTNLTFIELDESRLHLQLHRGSFALRVGDPAQAQGVAVEIPQGRVTLQDAGSYRFDTVASAESVEMTAVTALAGSAGFKGAGTSLTITAGQRAQLFGQDPVSYVVGDARPDSFDAWVLARDRTQDAPSASLRYVPPDMTGYQALDQYGQWQESPDYGEVWTPDGVSADWAPYSDGQWTWVAPWGWTWVDAAPWGFAPFHYGRWVIIRTRWAWVPGIYPVRSVYAPALVGWLGGSGWNPAAKPGSSVGWFPLGPHEAYYPPYPCTMDYARRVNARQVTSLTNIVAVRSPSGGRFTAGSPSVAPMDPGKLRYRYAAVSQAVTAVPAAALSAGRPVARERIRIQDTGAFATAAVSVMSPDIAPAARPVNRIKIAFAQPAAPGLVQPAARGSAPGVSKAHPEPGRPVAAAQSSKSAAALPRFDLQGPPAGTASPRGTSPAAPLAAPPVGKPLAGPSPGVPFAPPPPAGMPRLVAPPVGMPLAGPPPGVPFSATPTPAVSAPQTSYLGAPPPPPPRWTTPPPAHGYAARPPAHSAPPAPPNVEAPHPVPVHPASKGSN